MSLDIKEQKASSINDSLKKDEFHSDPLLESLIYIAKHNQLNVSHASLLGGLALVDGKLTPDLYLKAAERIGLNSSIVKRDLKQISDLVLPAVLILSSNNAVVLTAKGSNDSLTVFMPLAQAERKIKLDKLTSEYSGFAIFSSPKPVFDERVGEPKEHDDHWFWGVFRRSYKIYRDVLLASLLINIFVICNPLFVMNVYDRVVPNSAIETLWVLALGILVLFIFDFVLKLLRTYFIEVAGKKSDILLSSYILQRVLGARFEHHPKSLGAFVSDFKEFETVRNFVTSSTITGFIDLPFVVLFLVVIAYIGGAIVWVPIVLIPIVLLYAYITHRRLKNFVANMFAASTQKNATLVEAISGLETLKTLNAEGVVARKWDVAVGQLANWGLKTRVLSASATSFSGFIQQVAGVCVVVVGVYAIAERELTQGALIACVILVGRALSPFTQVTALLVQYYQSKLALESLTERVSMPQEHEAKKHFLQKPRLSGSIEFKAVNFRYAADEQDTLSNIHLKIKPGERIAIIGKIGSGKSTLQKLLLALYRPTDGNLLFDGVSSEQFNPIDLRNQISYVGQESELFFGSIRDNIMMGKVGVDDKELLRVSEIGCVKSWINQHPDAFEKNIGERGQLLSGGQRQTIALARALVGNPDICVFDEPTSAMDNSTESSVIKNLARISEGKNLILVTHKIALLALVNRVIVLDRGQIVADGPKNSVLEALKKGQLHVSS